MKKSLLTLLIPIFVVGCGDKLKSPEEARAAYLEYYKAVDTKIFICDASMLKLAFRGAEVKLEGGDLNIVRDIQEESTRLCNQSEDEISKLQVPTGLSDKINEMLVGTHEICIEAVKMKSDSVENNSLLKIDSLPEDEKVKLKKSAEQAREKAKRCKSELKAVGDEFKITEEELDTDIDSALDAAFDLEKE